MGGIGLKIDVLIIQNSFQTKSKLSCLVLCTEVFKVIEADLRVEEICSCCEFKCKYMHVKIFMLICHSIRKEKNLQSQGVIPAKLKKRK